MVLRLLTKSESKLNRLAGIALLSTFIFVALFGLSFSMPTDSMGNMTNCPWTSATSSICPMGAAQHIAEWQKLFAAIPQSNLMLALLGLLAVSLVFYIFKIVDNPYDLFVQRYLRYRLEHPDIALFNYLQLAFAQGIVQPTLYA